MLCSVHIKNFVLIKSLSIDFHAALNLITGETGAGKSIILDAIIFALNGKFGAEVVRHGSDYATVTAEFSYDENISSKLENYGISIVKGENIIISRWQSLEGKKRFTINNEPSTTKVIDDISEDLLKFYGQHSYSDLLKPAKHLTLLDQFGNLSEIKKIFSDHYNNSLLLAAKIKKINEDEQSALREQDYLDFVYKELIKANIKLGEEEELSNLRIQAQNKSKYNNLLKDSFDMLNKSNPISVLSSIHRLLTRNDKDNSFANILTHLDQAEVSISEVEAELARMLNKNSEELDIDNIEERLFYIRGLARKYSKTTDELVAYQDEIEHKLSTIEHADREKAKLNIDYSKAWQLVQSSAEKLSNLRNEAARKLEDIVKDELEPLKMSGCKFKVENNVDINLINNNGLDNVKFVASTNPGMPYSSIDKIASGGELSRFMLALQVAIFNNKSKEMSIIFDEIDTGIGGAIAEAVGARLQKLSEYCQVIAITHQPQVAGKADLHIKVSKTQSDDETVSSVTILHKEERVYEIARMISGKKITEPSLEAAKELIKK